MRIAPAFTLILAGTALTVALLISLLLGLVSAAWAGQWPDTVIRSFSSLGVAIPDFVVGLILLVVVVVGLHTGTVASDGAVSHVALPAAALALFPAARWTQILAGRTQRRTEGKLSPAGIIAYTML